MWAWGATSTRAYPAFAQVIDAADAELDFDLKALMFEGPEDKLNLTEYTQPAMVAFACGVTAVLAEQGVTPDYVLAFRWASILPWRAPVCLIRLRP